MRCMLPILAGTLMLAAFTPIVAGQTFDLVGLPAGANATTGQAVSDDGTVVAGAAYNSGRLRAGWHWTRDGGRADLSGAGLPNNTSAFGISGDGRYVVGSYATAQSYRYDRTSGQFELLPTPAPYVESRAEDASGDGGVVVGDVRFGTSTSAVNQAYRWTPQGGTLLLGYTRTDHFRSFAQAVSRDGSTIVGYSIGLGSSDAFVWRDDTGIFPLPRLPDSPDGLVRAFDVNFDGSVVVGFSTIGNDNIACVWRNGIVESLGPAPGFIRSSAKATNDDGSIIVGVLDNGSANSFQAGIWRQGIGWERLDTYLTSIGITLPAGVSLYEATSISADGRTIAGYSSIPGTVEQGFVVTIPVPGSSLSIAVAALLTAICRRR